MIQSGQRSTKARKTLPLLKSSLSSGTLSPFHLPQDEQLFEANQLLRKAKKGERLQRDSLKIWKRETVKGGLNIRDISELENRSQKPSDSFTHMNFMSAAKGSIRNNIQRSDSNYDFLKKKKEMVLYQLKIDHKREGILKLEDKTKSYQKGLSKTEALLQKDVENFNTYLTHNKIEVKEAVRVAEDRTKQKNQIARLVKQKLELKADLTGKINSKIEVLQNLIKYKEFLDDLNLVAHKQRPIPASIHRGQSSTQYLKDNFTISSELLDYLKTQKEQEEPLLGNAQKLPQVFLKLQQFNLHCITSLNNIEERLESVKMNHHERKRKMWQQRQDLTETKAELLSQLQSADQEVKLLKELKLREHKEVNTQLQSEIQLQFTLSNSKQYERRLHPIQILRQTQKRLESYIKQMNQIRDENSIYVDTLQKNCNIERREKNKGKSETGSHLITQPLSLELRNLKRLGRPIMFKCRAQVETCEDSLVCNQVSEEQLDRRKYFN